MIRLTACSTSYLAFRVEHRTSPNVFAVLNVATKENYLMLTNAIWDAIAVNAGNAVNTFNFVVFSIAWVNRAYQARTLPQ